MTVLWVVVAVAVEIAAGRAVGALFRRRGFDAHVAEALTVVEPSDDFELWSREIRGAA